MQRKCEKKNRVGCENIDKMLNKNVFYRFFMFLNRFFKKKLHLSSPQINQIK